MYDYIDNVIAELNPTYAVIDCSGLGYHVNISLHTFSKIEGLKNTKLFLHQIVREDVHLLYGFSTKAERELFRMLLSVSGVGANTARMILSTFSPEELQSVISTENAALLKTVKGLGIKTAQKIIVDLSGKMISSPLLDSSSVALNVDNPKQDEAIEALVMLGFTKAACQKVIKQVLKNQPSLSVEELIRTALKQL